MALIRRRIVSLSDVLDDEEPAQNKPESDIFSEMVRRIRAGKVVPIVSNAIINQSIFAVEQDSPLPTDEAGSAGAADHPNEESGSFTSIENELGRSWAKKIGYPLPDSYDLARVAQYNRTVSKDDERSKVDFLRFLKESLLKIARMKGADIGLLMELRGRIEEASFTDLCQELDYPKVSSGKTDPLQTLARLPLPIYITTSFYDFLERALTREGRKPRTQICFWSGETLDVAPEHKIDLDLDPTVENPLVYHLLGFERYPTTIAISEDDYLDFMAQVILDTDTRDPVIPLYLRDALSSSALLLLGYGLQDWDFRVMFRGVIRPRQAVNRMRSMIIQLTPEQQYHIANAQKAREYLVTYFDPMNFSVEWGDTATFIDRLWQEWKRRQV